MNAVVNQVRSIVIFLVVLPVRFYQIVLRPVLPAVCRFYPTCSEYFIEAVHKDGPIKGAAKGLWRFCRCNPWNRGGYDPP
jgi:putative membrane protein insertion efficiency factor